MKLGLLFVWLVGLRDYALTRGMIDACGRESELNAIASWLVASFGSAALLPYKLALLVLFTAVVFWIMRRDLRTATRVLGVSVAVHAALAAWWNVVLFVRMDEAGNWLA